MKMKKLLVCILFVTQVFANEYTSDPYYDEQLFH